MSTLTEWVKKKCNGWKHVFQWIPPNCVPGNQTKTKNRRKSVYDLCTHCQSLSVGHLLCRPGVYMLLWHCSGVLQPPLFCTAVFQACPHNNSAGDLQRCSSVCGPGGGERTRPGLQCQEVRTGTLMSLAPVGPIQTFPFLSDRNPLWTRSSQPTRLYFSPKL